MRNHWCKGKTRGIEEERQGPGERNWRMTRVQQADIMAKEQYGRSQKIAIAEVKGQLMHYARMILARQEDERRTV